METERRSEFELQREALIRDANLLRERIELEKKHYEEYPNITMTSPINSLSKHHGVHHLRSKRATRFEFFENREFENFPKSSRIRNFDKILEFDEETYCWCCPSPSSSINQSVSA